MAQDREFQHRTPISAHPAFPLIVGLWFAALLGLGTIVLPAVVLEKAAAMTGLSSVFPQAEPPLTAGARAAVALLATIVGLVGGLALARRVAEAQHGRQALRRRAPRGAGANPAPPRPLSVHEDLGEAAIGTDSSEARPPFPGRRRPLAVAEEARTSDYLFAAVAPLPGSDAIQTPELPADEDAMTERPSEIEIPGGPIEPTDEPDFAVPASEQLAPVAPQAPEGAQVFAPAAEADPSEPPVLEPYVPPLDTRKPRDFAAPAPSETVQPAEATEPEPEPLVLEPIGDAPLEDLGIVQLVERLGRSLHRRLSAPQPETGVEIEPEPGPEGESLEFSAPSLEHDEAPALAVPPPVVPDALRAFMDAAPEDAAPAAEAGEAPQVPVPVVPDALRPFAFDPLPPDGDEEGDETALDPGPFTLPLDSASARPLELLGDDAPLDDEEDEDDDGLTVSDESFSSLLAMRNAFRQPEEFVRIEEPTADDDAIEPAVVFPGQEAGVAPPETDASGEAEVQADAPVNPARPFDAPHQPAPSTAPARARPAADPVETERALRSALANLQRMSGAA